MHTPRVLPVSAAADAQVVPGCRNPQFFKEGGAKAGIEVLSGVQQYLLQTAFLSHGPRHGGGLDELGARPYDGGYLHCDKSSSYSASNFSFSRSQL